MVYNVSVTDKKIRLISKTEDAVGGNKGDTINFTLDNEWQGQEVKAAFLYNGVYRIRKIENSVCEVPPIYNSVSFRLGVFVGNDEDSLPYLSSTTIELPCLLSTRDYLSVSKMDDEDFYVEALRVLDEIRDVAENATEEAREEVTKLVGELGVVQRTGDSPTSVMSQKAVTDELDSINNRFVGNLIEKATVLEKTYIRNTGELVTPAPDFFTVVIPCEANTAYKLVFQLARFITYYNGETLISGHDYGDATNLNTVITTPENCNFVKITGYYYDNPDDMVKNMEQKYFGTGVNILKYDRLAPSIKVNMLNMPLDYIDTCNQRTACISFIFDDGIPQDSEIYKAFADCGFACGFALPTNISESEYERYKKYYNDGFSILSHSVDSNGFSNTSLTLSQAGDKFKQSRRTLESEGFKVNGWVTPSSQMNDIYIPTLEGYYSYGFTQYYNEDTETTPPYNTIADRPWRLKRRYLGTSLSNLQTIANDAIDHRGFLTFYYHSRDLGTDMTVDTLKEFLNWLAVHVGNYDAEVLPPDLAIRYYYRKRIWD